MKKRFLFSGSCFSFCSRFFFCSCFSFLVVSVQAQEMQMDHSMHKGHKMAMDSMDMPMMSHLFSRNLPMSRNGSGTGWLPDASPMYGYMIHTKKWMYMAHGNIDLRYDNQHFNGKSGQRGDHKWDAPDWFMFMGQRNVGKNGQFVFSTMFSLDAVTGGHGYPLLFQTGESYKGIPLKDWQHPHDLFAELGIGYTQALSKKVDVFGYLGYPGEPALGPVTFMHRPSAMDNPNAPISHHWMDATHITFGVATLGLRVDKWKLEASSFNGREPDEHRYDFDKLRFDSWSGRLSFNPSKNWALQVSHAYQKSPEDLHPEENVNKTTASAIYSTALSGGDWFSATAGWGLNQYKDHGEHAVLLEASWHTGQIALYGRYEFTQKSAEELVLTPSFTDHTLFPVNMTTLGLNYHLLHAAGANLAVGANLSWYSADAKLDPWYGKNPLSFEAYIRIYPGRMRM